MLRGGCQFSLKLLLGNCCGCPYTVVGDDRGFCRVFYVMCGVGKVFEFNHKIMINVQKSFLGIMVARNL